MKTIIFGGSGYLGSHTAEQLAKAGHDVVCVVRTNSDCSFLETLPVTIVQKDFNDLSALSSAIEPGSAVFSCVADTRTHISDKERRIVEVDLASRLFTAAQQAGAKRYIQLSTVMIYGFDRPATPIDETWPVRPTHSYSRMAREREQALLDLQPGSGLELIILRPSNTFGKRDTFALPTLLSAHEKGNFPVIGGGKWNFSCMDARDVGRAMVHLLDVPVTEPVIFLAKANDISWLEVKSAMDRILGRQTRLVNVPQVVARALGWLMEKLYPYGKNPPLSRFGVEALSTHTLFDDRKIRGTGFRPKYDLMETLCDGLEKPMPSGE